MRKSYIILLVCVSTLLFYNISFSQTTRTSTGTGNWGTASTWSPSGVPAANDPVMIANGHTVTVNTTAVCASLTINSGGNSSTLTISGSNSLTVSGAVTINGGTGSSDNKTIAVGSGTFSCTSVTMVDPGNDNRDCRVTISTGTVTVSGNITMNGSAARNQVTFTGAGNLNIGGSITGGDLISVTGCTVNYNGTGTQIMYKKDYLGNIICSGSGPKICSPPILTDTLITISGNVTVKTGSELKTDDIHTAQLSINGNFTVEAGATVNVGGMSGGRLVVTGTGKTHIISGTVNVFWALRFDYPSGTSTSTVTVNSGAVITNDSAASGQLAIQNSVAMTFAVGSTLINKNSINAQSWTGVYLLNNGKLTINGTFTNGINGSIYIGNSNALTVNGTFNYPSATWITGTNNIVYGSTATLVYTGGTITMSNYEYPTTNSPFNLSINVGSANTVTFNNNRTVNGTLTLSNGILNLSTYTLTLPDNGTINRSNGSISKAPIFTTNCNLIYSNTNNITTSFELPPATGTILNNLTIQSAPDATVTLNANATVKGTATLTMNTGNINTGAYILMLGTATGARGTLVYNSGNIITGASGGFTRWFTNTTVSNVYFPVGTSSAINMITLSFTGAPTNGGSLTAKFIATDPGILNPFIDDAGYNVETFSKKGYWQLDAGNGLTGGIYSLSLRGQGFNPLGGAISVTNYPKLRIIKSTNSGSNWIVNGTHLNATGSNIDPTIQRTGLSGFSQYAMGGNYADENPLDGSMPVELASFTANVISRDVKLNWTTASESNNSGFEIQRSIPNEKNNWLRIGFISGNGTKTTPTNYTFEDKKLNMGKYKYRLKQIDYNGNYEYFNLANEVIIGIPNKYDISQNYPNPFNPTAKIDFDLPFDSKVSIKLYDMSGREVMTLFNEQRTAGYYTIDFNGNNLSSGTYFYRINAEGNGKNYIMTKKAILVK